MPVRTQHIGTGDKAIFVTVEYMQKMARADAQSPVIQRIADGIRKECGGDKMCRAKSAFNYIVKNVKYEYDHILVKKYVPSTKNPKSTEFFSRPSILLSKIHEGDCDDMATALCSLYLALGLPTKFKVIDWKPEGGFSHVYSLVQVDGKWLGADAVKKVFDWEKSPINRSAECELGKNECSVDFLENNIMGISGFSNSASLAGMFGLSGDFDPCITETFNRVNYNSGCSLKNPCYSAVFVADIIKYYSDLLTSGKISAYDRAKLNQEQISVIEKAVADASKEEQGRVAAVLYNMYYGIFDGIKNKTPGFEKCKDLITKKASKIYWIAGGAILTFVGGYWIWQNGKKKNSVINKLQKKAKKLLK